MDSASIRYHLRSYPFSLPFSIQERHRRQFEQNEELLHQWAADQGRSLRIVPKVLGDPHEPNGTQVLEVMLDSARIRYFWKHGTDRFKIESACQSIIAILGPESGIEALHGIPMGAGGAWRKIKFRPVRDQEKEAARRGLAHMIVMAACFNMPDIHHENARWDGGAFRLIDVEFFSGPEKIIQPYPWFTDRRTRIAQRVVRSCLLPFAGAVLGTGESISALIEEVAYAMGQFRKHWPEIMKVRKKIDGLQARILHRSTTEYYRLIPFAISNVWTDRSWNAIKNNVPPSYNIELDYRALCNACIPIHHKAIPAWDDPEEGVIEPDATMLGVIRGMLLPGWLEDEKTKSPSLNGLLEMVKVEDPQDSDTAISYATLTKKGLEVIADEDWNHAGFCHGLGGLVLLHHAEKQFDVPMTVSTSIEIVDGFEKRIASERPRAGVNLGLAGEWMLGWGLQRMGVLSSAWQRVLEDRLQYVSTVRQAPVLDLAIGLVGTLLGLARASEIIPNRTRDIRQMGQQLVHLIQEELRECQETKGAKAVIGLGFAHGLAGVVYALSEAKRQMGYDVPELENMVTLLRVRLAGRRWDKRKAKDQKNPHKPEPFCSSLDGVEAVLRLVGGCDAGWMTEGIRNYIPSYSRQTTCGCCGTAAGHLARVSPMREEIPTAACRGCTPFGYYGVAGFHYLRLTRLGTVWDPLWGREVLPVVG